MKRPDIERMEKIALRYSKSAGHRSVGKWLDRLDLINYIRHLEAGNAARERTRSSPSRRSPDTNAAYSDLQAKLVDSEAHVQGMRDRYETQCGGCGNNLLDCAC